MAFFPVATNLYDAFLPLRLLLVPLGVQPYSLQVSSTPRQNRVQLCACLLVCGILMAWNYDYRYWNKWNSPVVIMCGIVMQTVSFCEPTLAIVAGFLLKSKTQRLLLKLHHFDVQVLISKQKSTIFNSHIFCSIKTSPNKRSTIESSKAGLQLAFTVTSSSPCASC